MEVDTSPLPNLPGPFHWGLGGSEFSRHSSQAASSNILDVNIFGPNLRAGTKGMDSKKSYFDMSPRGMGSSPTSSLVADLSQNLSIDKTPQVPTPRRSLFMGATGLGGRTLVTTPPIPSSSPGHDSMDISPLPHKPAFQSMQSPMSPCNSSLDADMSLCSSPPSAAKPVADPPKRPVIPERRRTTAQPRPSLMRNSNRYSTSNAVSFKSTASERSISFPRATTAPQINLENLFGAASPSQDEKNSSPSGNMLAPPRPKFFSLASPNDGSPIPSMNRTSRSTLQRPKGKVRRTLSMFEHPEDVIQNDVKDEEANDPALCPNFAAGENAALPSFTIRDDPLRRISKETMIDVIDGKYEEHYDHRFIVDCRFEYEFEGGHIKEAINVNSIEALDEMFFDANLKTGRVLMIFHCEYSAHRAPRMALHLRSRDRQDNMQRYPDLSYPDVYILDGGYSTFFSNHRERCNPQHYIEMNDSRHQRTCEKEMSKFRRNTKFGRTQSFTFGIQNESMDSSPSASLSRRPNGSCGKEADLGQLRQRCGRMASY